MLAETHDFHTIVYIYDSGNVPIGMMYRATDDTLWTNYWFEKNLQGDIIAIWTDGGVKCLSYTYDAWGNWTQTIHYRDGVGGYYYNNFRYRGYYFDGDLGLYWTQTRLYDANTGRFISLDLLGVISATPMGLTDKNLYLYCDNNPIMRVDHGGAFWDTIFDVVSLAFSVVDVIQDPSDEWAWIGLAGDVVDLIPFVSGVGETTRAARTVQKITDNALDVADVADDVIDATDAIRDTRKNQQALHELADEINRNAKNGKFISFEEAKIFDEWCTEYGVKQHHRALKGSGKHWKTGWDHTHIFGKHIPFMD